MLKTGEVQKLSYVDIMFYLLDLIGINMHIVKNAHFLLLVKLQNLFSKWKVEALLNFFI